MSNKTIHSHLASQTKKAGFVFGKEILKKPIGKTALVLALQGDLGAGKTTFIQGLARGLGIKEKVNSPTFVIMKKFVVPSHKLFYHFDCYRLRSDQDVLALGFAEIIANSQNIVAIEWPDNIKSALPKEVVKIALSHCGGNQRQINISDF